MLYPDSDTPSVLLNLDAVEGNIDRMAGIAGSAGLKLDTGSKTFSQDRTVADTNMGHIIGWQGWTLKALTEEHGIVEVPEDADVTIGGRLEIIPNHACVMTNPANEFVTTRDGQVQGTLSVAARGLSR